MNATPRRYDVMYSYPAIDSALTLGRRRVVQVNGGDAEWFGTDVAIARILAVADHGTDATSAYVHLHSVDAL